MRYAALVTTVLFVAPSLIWKTFWTTDLGNLRSSKTQRIVTTACGQVAAAISTESVDVFMGIPYARPPINDLRWKPPMLPQCPWEGTLSASVPAPPCVQGDSGLEDCLYLNIVVPSTVTALKPVVVYFHGGNLIEGSAGGELSKAQNLAKASDLIVVTAAYRLGVLGWLATEDLAEEQGGTAGNYGLQDAISALKWIKENIASFGGDPSRVILMGQSSGGTLIFSLLASHASEGLFVGAISLSGSPNITMNQAAKFLQDAPLVTALNCSSHSQASERLACMRSLPASIVAEVMPASWGTPGIWGWQPSEALPSPADGGENYAGIVYVDGTWIRQSFNEGLASGLHSNVGVIVSNLAAEPDGGRHFALQNKSQWNNAVASAFRDWPSGTASKIQSLYAAEAEIEPRLAYGTFVTDYGLTCPNQALAQRISQAGVKTASLYMLYDAWPVTDRPPDKPYGHWPYHGQDWQEIGVEFSGGWIPSSPRDLAIRGILQKMVKDLAENSGKMPLDWNWAPVTRDYIGTLVLAEEAVYPYGGVRVEEMFNNKRCAALLSLGFDLRYAWCD